MRTKQILVLLLLFLLFINSGCTLLNLHTTRSIYLRQKPFDKCVYFDLRKVTVYMDSKELVADLKKIKNKESERLLSIIAKSDTVEYSIYDSIYKNRMSNKYLIKLLKKGKVVIVDKRDNSKVNKIKRKWINTDCNNGYGYYLNDSILFYTHFYKLCPY